MNLLNNHINKDLFSENNKNLFETWSQFLILLEKDLGKKIIDTWFRSLNLYFIDKISKLILIQASNKFIKEWVEKNYIKNIENVFCRVLVESFVTIKIILDDEKNNFKSSKLTNILPAIKISGKNLEQKNYNKNKIKLLLNNINIKNSNINKNYNFDNFIVGSGNDLAYSSIKYLIENEDSSWYNFLLIYGKTGIGKTHLIQSLVNYLEKNKISFLYQTSNDFVENYIKSVKNNNIDEFEKLFNYIDYLIIEDLQFLSKKPQTQEILFKLINLLLDNNKKIILSSNNLPRNIIGLSDKIKSKLDGALVVDLSMPEYETALEIINQKLKIYKLDLEDGIAEYIASSTINSIREIEGFIIKLSAYSSIKENKITIKNISKIISSLKNSFNMYFQDENIYEIIQFITKKYNITFLEVKEKNKKKNFLIAKYLIIYSLKKYLFYSSRDISKIFDYNDHTTIIYAIKKIELLLKTDYELNCIIKEIENILKIDKKINMQNKLLLNKS